MTNVSDLFPAGGGNNTISMVASGALGNGDRVVLQSNGTVKVVTDSDTTESIPAGTAEYYSYYNASYMDVAFDPRNSNKFVVAYQDTNDNSKGKARVGTVSGTTISFGTEHTFQSSDHPILELSIVFDPNDSGTKFIISYRSSSGYYGKIQVGTVSGTTISTGSPYTFNSGNTSHTDLAFDPNTTGKFAVTYMDNPNSSAGTVKIGNITGTTIAYGSSYNFQSQDGYYPRITFDLNTPDTFVVVCKNGDVSYYPAAFLGTITGTSISYQNPVIISSTSRTDALTAVFSDITAGMFVVAYSYTSNYYGYAKVGTVSGTSISFGSEVTLNSGTTYRPIDISNDPFTDRFVVVYKDAGNSSYGTLRVGSVSGTSISFGSEIIFNNGTSNYPSISFDPNNIGNFIISYQGKASGVGYNASGSAILGHLSTSNLTSTSLLGIAQATVADTETVEVETLGGLATNLSGLTIGSKYYVQGDGTITTNSSGQLLGRAITATTINMRDFT